MATRIVNKFGMDTMDVIEQAPEKLREVSGLGKKRVDTIKQAWEAQREIKNVMLFSAIQQCQHRPCGQNL